MYRISKSCFLSLPLVVGPEAPHPRCHPRIPRRALSLLSISEKQTKTKGRLEASGVSRGRTCSSCQEPFQTDACLDLALDSRPLLNIVIRLENKQREMDQQPREPFRGSLMTLWGQGVARVKADQRGCGASSQDRVHKSHPFSEEAIFFFHLPSELKYNHNRHIVAPTRTQRL